MKWELKPYYTRWLTGNESTANMVFSVSATEDYAAVSSSAKRCVAFLIDKSGSMEKPASEGSTVMRLAAACSATRKGIEALSPGTIYFVIAFDAEQHVIVTPRAYEGGSAPLSEFHLLLENGPSGNTKFAPLFRLTAEIFSNYADCVCAAVLLTDGKNDERDRGVMEGNLKKSKSPFALSGLDSDPGFPLYCLGLGLDWDPEMLRNLASRTGGEALMIPSQEWMDREFVRLVHTNAKIRNRSVDLCLTLPSSVRLVSARQVLPCLSEIPVMPDGKNAVLALGMWGAETRDYMLTFSFPPLPVGEKMMVCRPGLMADGTIVAPAAPVVVEWCSDNTLTAVLNPVVSHYNGQAEKAGAIEEGLRALAAGDMETATRRLGTAARLASQSSDTDTLKKLAGVVDIIDAEAGTVRVYNVRNTAAVMDLDVSSTRTVRAER